MIIGITIASATLAYRLILRNDIGGMRDESWYDRLVKALKLKDVLII